MINKPARFPSIDPITKMRLEIKEYDIVYVNLAMAGSAEYENRIAVFHCVQNDGVIVISYDQHKTFANMKDLKKRLGSNMIEAERNFPEYFL